MVVMIGRCYEGLPNAMDLYIKHFSRVPHSEVAIKPHAHCRSISRFCKNADDHLLAG